MLGSPTSLQPLSHGGSSVPPSEPRDDGGTSPPCRDHMQLSSRQRRGVAITHPIVLGIRGLVGDSRGRTSPPVGEGLWGQPPASFPPWRPGIHAVMGAQSSVVQPGPPYRALSGVWGSSSSRGAGCIPAHGDGAGSAVLLATEPLAPWDGGFPARKVGQGGEDNKPQEMLGIAEGTAVPSALGPDGSLGALGAARQEWRDRPKPWHIGWAVVGTSSLAVICPKFSPRVIHIPL